jgi:hypothetical protein
MRSLFTTVFSRLALAGMALSMLSACSTFNIGPKDSLHPSEAMTTFGVNPLFEGDRFELIDLIQLVDPKGLRKGIMKDKGLPFRATHPYSKPFSDPSQFDSAADARDRAELEAALLAFYDTEYSEPHLPQTTRVARVQDRIIAASEQRCGAYKIYLKRFEVYNDTTLGIGSLIAGGVGSIAKSAGIAQRWAALAGILGGSRAEVRQGFFGNLASYVIIPGIDAKRKEIHNEMLSKRNDGGGLKVYTVEAAIADAARFHAACSLETGLEHAKDSISLVENPGQRMFLKSMNSAYVMRQAVDAYGSLEAGKLPTTAPKLVAMDFSAVDSGIIGTPTANGSAAYVVPKAAATANDANAIITQLNAIKKYYDGLNRTFDGALKIAEPKKCDDVQSVSYTVIESRVKDITKVQKPSIWNAEYAKMLTMVSQFEAVLKNCSAIVGTDAASDRVNTVNQAKNNLEGEIKVFLATLNARFADQEKKVVKITQQIQSCSKETPQTITYATDLTQVPTIDEGSLKLKKDLTFTSEPDRSACTGIFKTS